MSVDTVHPDYEKAIDRYKLIRAIINNDAKNYIRAPEIENGCFESQRNIQYRDDAILTNFTALTADGLTGLVFRKEPKIKLPEKIRYLEDDVTGTGINIYQFSQQMVYETLQLGRYGLLVDYFNTGSRAYIKPYIAESIINWKTRSVDGVVKLSLAVLVESYLIDEDDIFSQAKAVQYRVIMLNEKNLYVQQIWREQTDSNNKKFWGPIVSYDVVDYNNNRFNFLPLNFIGSVNNDWEVDKSPLYDLAVLNLGHYRNSADFEESIFLNGQPYLVIGKGENVSQEEFLEANPGGIAYGSRRALILNKSDVQLLQANPNQLVAQAMKDKLEQAARVGARLVEAAGGRETAEAARIRYGSQHSVLYTLASNAEWAMKSALITLCMFMGADPLEIEFELNKEYFEDTADANLITTQIALMQNGVISKNDIRDYGRKTGFISSDRTNEELDADSEVSVADEENNDRAVTNNETNLED